MQEASSTNFTTLTMHHWFFDFLKRVFHMPENASHTVLSVIYAHSTLNQLSL